MFAVWVAESDVDAGKLFVLKDVADDATDADVGADGELAYAIGVFVGVGISPEVLLELLVGAGAGDDAVLRDVDGERGGFEEAVAAQSQSPTTPSTTNAPLTSPGEVKHSPPGRLPHFSGEMMPEVLNHL